MMGVGGRGSVAPLLPDLLKEAQRSLWSPDSGRGPVSSAPTSHGCPAAVPQLDGAGGGLGFQLGGRKDLDLGTGVLAERPGELGFQGVLRDSPQVEIWCPRVRRSLGGHQLAQTGH